MALYPTNFETKFRLSPGGRGETFVADMPGYRDGATRINRTNNTLSVSSHEDISGKFILDKRLPAQFKYGFMAGYNNMVVTKGRIVAADPYMDAADWQSDREFNVLTLANGGTPVRLREDTDVYSTKETLVSEEGRGNKAHGVGLNWVPVAGMDEAWKDGIYRACKTAGNAQLKAANMGVDAKTGKIVKDATFDAGSGAVVGGTITEDVRPANVPLGMIERNECSRFDNDSFDGMIPGPVITDKIVELPYFQFKDKAEKQPWGAIYGTLKVGDLVKSDENGRLVVSPLSYDAVLDDMTAAEIERERQQVVGQVVGFNHNMVPEGGYELAQWALEDRLRYEGFNPDVYTQTNRPGEDNVNSSIFQSTGRYPGYPYDKAYTEHDLHMIGNGTGRAGNYDKFMPLKYQLDNGIPGLTDGGNAALRSFENNHAAEIGARKDKTQPYVRNVIRVCQNGNFEDGSLELQLVDPDGTEVLAYKSVTAPCDLNDAFKVTYYNAVQGLICIEVKDEAKADTALAKGYLTVNLKFKKRGQAGVPTFMDWDGCVGSAKILLQR